MAHRLTDARSADRPGAIFRAFVSSTFEDLKVQRSQVIGALRNARFWVDPMEDWTAAADAPKNLSVERLNGCDLCVLLVGFRRGHVPSGQTLSITQLEYQAAVGQGIDVLVFMLDEHAAWPRAFDELDKDPGIRLWRQELMEKATVGLFNHELGSIKIDPAISRWVVEKYRSAMEAAEGFGELVKRSAEKNDSEHRLLRSILELVQALAAGSGPRIT